MRIFLIRHGESEGNIDHRKYAEIGDPQIELTDKGWQQAVDAGKFLQAYLEENNLQTPERIWASSFLRTKQTLRGVIEGLDMDKWNNEPDIREDLRLAEQHFGYIPFVQTQKGFLRKEIGKALVAFSRAVHKKNPYLTVPPMGEAPMTSYKRVDSFMNTLHRDRENRGIKNVMIVSHGATIKNFMMRWFHLPLDGWPQLKTPGNTDIFMLDNESPPRCEWRITRIYDGENGIAAGNNPIEGIQRLSKGNLPDLPEFLAKPKAP